jgi:hypothetical protein
MRIRDGALQLLTLIDTAETTGSEAAPRAHAMAGGSRWASL